MSDSRIQQARDFIYGKLARGELQAGARLSNRKIAEEIGVSAIPVREAISRLAGEGFVEHHPKVGAFVAKTDRQELAELYDLREALECHAVGVASRTIDAEDLGEMQRQNEVMRGIVKQLASAGTDLMDTVSSDQWLMADAAFHMVILRASGNRRIIKAVSDLRVMASIFGFRQRGRTRQRLAGTCDEHDKIIQAMRDGDADAGRQAMAEHIRRGCEVALKAFDRRRAEALHDRIHRMEQD